MPQSDFELVDRHLGRAVQIARGRAGLTVSMLAAMMRVVPDQLALAEMGRRRLTPSQIIRAAGALRVTPEAFYEGLEATLRPAPHLRVV